MMQQEHETAELTDQKGGKRALHPFVQGVVQACSGGQMLRRCGEEGHDDWFVDHDDDYGDHVLLQRT